MPVSDNEPVCPEFQPNIFDSSRCHDCLRQRSLHSDAAVTTGGAHRPSAAAGTGSALVPQGKGHPLLPIPVEEEERDTSAKDSDSLSVVSSYCDVRGGRLGYAESSVCILSPDCELYICDGDDGDSTDSCCEHSVYTELSDSVSAEDDYLPVRRRPTRHSTMTRLDPPPHRPNPRAWMDEARSRDGFGRNSGLKGERENRESGYFSLGRASGARSFKDKSPPPPFRHYERGHPLYSTRDTEPKATVPFRNPNLGLASERLNPEVLYQEVPLGELPPPDPYGIAVEVEARVGARSPSPTPFKIAESLASSGRRGIVNKGSLSSSYQPPGRFDSSRQGSALHSRSSSPSRGNMPFKRAESTTSLSGRGIEGRGFEGRGWQQGRDQGPRGPSQSSFGKVSGSGTLPRNFKSFPNPVKSQANCFSDFKSTLRKTEVNGSSTGRGLDNRNPSPSRRGYETPRQTPLCKTESSSSALNGHGREGCLPPTSRGSYDTSRNSPRFSSPARRSCDTASQPLLRKSESVTSLNVHGRPPRCGSPIREGYDIESQSLLRNSETRSTLNEHERESHGASTTGRGNDTQGQSALRRSEPNAYGDGGGRGIRESPSLSRRSYETSGQSGESGQSLLRKTETNSSVKSRGLESRNPSPSRRGYDTPGQTGLRKSEATASVRSHSHSRDSHGPSPSRRSHEAPVQSVLRKTETSGSLTNNRSHNSRRSSPPRRNDPPGQSSLRKPTSREAGVSYQSKTTYSEPDANPSPRSWRGSSHNLHDSSLSHVTSPSRHTRENTRSKSTTFSEKAVNTETTGESSIRSYSGGRGFEARSSSPDDRRPSHRIRSPSPRTRRLASSQSSAESSESGQLSEGSTGRNKEEYAVLADLPKVKRVLQRDIPGHAGRPQHHLFKPASHSLSRHPSREWEDQADLERQEHRGSWLQGSSGRLSRAQSSTSIYIQSPSSPDIEEESSRWSEQRLLPQHMQPDLLNFKKGWMSKLDDNGEWKKHWFVLTDAGLRYYRDSGAEEKDDLDGDIDLKSCIKVSEFDVEKNYGFQIQTREAMFTLSAMTAGIRRNWIEVLRKSIRPSSSPDLTQLPDSSSDKENSHSRPMPLSSRRPSSRLEIPTSAPPTCQRKFDYVELSPVPVPAPAPSNSPLPASQREAGEGQGREHAQWQEERNQEATSSQWEAVLTRKGTPPDPKLRMEDEIERRWAEFERLPLKEMRSLPAMGVSRPSQPANEALRREVASLRHQLERLRGGGGGAGGGGGGGECGPEAPCSRSLASMERAHRQALEELQRQQERQVREMEEERDRLLREETRDTAQVIEALKKAHEEEIEREVEKAKRLGGMVADPQSLQAHQQAEAQSLQRELAGLSERYSQKCLELNRAEQSNALREREISRKERDMEQLRKENQELQSRLTEEITRMRTIVTGRGSDKVSNDNRDRSSCGLEVLLRVKENELQYLQKEASCLRNELQFLNTEKRLACERYNEVHEELTGMKGRSEREIQSLKEHLRLAMAALQEGQRLGNSLEH